MRIDLRRVAIASAIVLLAATGSASCCAPTPAPMACHQAPAPQAWDEAPCCVGGAMTSPPATIAVSPPSVTFVGAAVIALPRAVRVELPVIAGDSRSPAHSPPILPPLRV
jgi:hypothetical protein